MIGALASPDDPRAAARDAFARALAGFDRARPVVVLGHFDADGLAAVAILVRALAAAGWNAVPRITGKGETAWDAAATLGLVRNDSGDPPPPGGGGAAGDGGGGLTALTVSAPSDRLRRPPPPGGGGLGSRADPTAPHQMPGGLIVCDLGTSDRPVLPGVPTVIVDHHVPTGLDPAATVVSGKGLDPEPTSALIAWWCAAALGDPAELLWLAALGLIGDMAQPFPELAAAEARWGKTALKDATALVNAPRRTAAADPSPALALLLRGDGPKAITKEASPERDALVAAKAEVREAMDAAKRVGPRVAGDVALIRFSSPCQIHPLIAQQWRGRLKDKIVLAANTGYRPGWVHFAARSARGDDLVEFLAAHRPPGTDSRYGNGHAQATGGALRPADWNAFVRGLGLPDQQVPYDQPHAFRSP